jgi:uncharacterized protein (DUF58 family)
MRWFFGLLLILAAAWTIDSGLLAYAAYVLLGVLLLTRVITRNGLNLVTAERECGPTEVEVGERVEVALTIRNEGGLPIPWVLFEDVLPGFALAQRPPRLRVKGRRIQIKMLRGGQEIEIRYKVDCVMRGFYPIGPLVLESGDLFGLHRRYRVVARPAFVTVYPKVVPLAGYDIASRRPIGDVRLVHRLFEDPTRISGVRPYEAGDPLNRVHWRATARTGRLHSKVYDPSTMAGAMLLLDLNHAGYPARGEPHRSDLAVTTAVSLANAVSLLGQQVGLATNGRDAAERLAGVGFRQTTEETADSDNWLLAKQLREASSVGQDNERRQPQVIRAGRGVDQFQRIRELLARAEVNDGLTFAEFVLEAAPQLPRDATVLAVLPAVPVETAFVLGNLRRSGFAVTVVLVMLGEGEVETAYGRLAAEGIRDVRPLASEQMLSDLCQSEMNRTPYMVSVG